MSFKMDKKLKKKSDFSLRKRSRYNERYTNVENDAVYKLKLSAWQKICNRHKV